MDNLLPQFKSFSVENNRQKKTMWKPASSIPDNKPVIPKRLSSNTDPEKTNLLPPNDRYMTDAKLSGSSPLSRGTSEKPQINFIAPSKKDIAANIQNNFIIPTGYVMIHNSTSQYLELFFQNSKGIIFVDVEPSSTCERLLNGSRDIETKGNFELYISTTRAAVIPLTLRQEIRDFLFNKGPIGMEVEMSSNNKLSCCQVFPNTQASFFINGLIGAEIIAINEARVLNLESFENELRKAQFSSDAFISIKVASFRGGKLKLDELYTDEYKKSKKIITTLLSNAFCANDESSEDHQYDIVLPSASGPCLDSFSSSVSDVVISNIGLGDSPEKKSVTSFLVEGDSASFVRSISSSQTKKDRQLMRVNSLLNVSMDEFDPESALMADKTKSSAQLLKSKEAVQILNLLCHENLSNGEDGSTHDSEDTSKADSNYSWEFATALDQADVTIHKALVCMPPNLRKSELGWNDPPPKFGIQFANFSTNWEICVYWIDEDSSLVPRSTLYNGQRHSEILSSDHLWCVIATFITRDVRNKLDSNWAAIALSSDQQKNEIGYYVEKEADVVGKTSICMVFRPPVPVVSTLSQTMVSTTWVPWASCTFSEVSKRNVYREMNSQSYIDNPTYLFQVFDQYKSESK